MTFFPQSQKTHNALLANIAKCRCYCTALAEGQNPKAPAVKREEKEKEKEKEEEWGVLKLSKSVAAALSWLLLIASAPIAHAHASLSHATLSGGSALSTAPQEVALTFTDTLEAAFSNVTVTDASGIEVSQGKVQVNGNVMRVSLKPLSAGLYKVKWRAVSTDTHKTEGNFTFSVEAH